MIKKIVLSLCLFSALQVVSQNTKYFDHNWKPSDANYARFASQAERTDSGWVRRDFYLSTKKSKMRGLYKDSALTIENGWFRSFYVNMVLASQGNYVNGKKEGLWLSYYYNGVMKDSIIYAEGQPLMAKGWHSNGGIADSSAYDKDGYTKHIYWFDNGVISHTGRSYRGKREGEWKFYHNNGRLAAMQNYGQSEQGNIAYYNEDNRQLAEPVGPDRPAAFKGGQKKWRAFLLDKLDFLDDVKLKNTFFVTVVLALTIDEAGNITDVYVDVPVSPKFDEQAIKVIKKSPAWLPAIDHNRYVKSTHMQAITFGQVD